MRYEDRFDSLIRYHAARLWPEADWRLIKAQVAAESGFRPLAVSPCGAVGLLQLMPATFAELTQAGHITDCDDNLAAGIRHLKEQFDRLDEIPEPAERLKFALAAYNGGRGYVNRAIALAAQAENIDTAKGHPRTWPLGRWQSWETARTYLAVSGCQVGGKRPDYRQMWDYVERVMRRWADLRAAGGGAA